MNRRGHPSHQRLGRDRVPEGVDRRTAPAVADGVSSCLLQAFIQARMENKEREKKRRKKEGVDVDLPSASQNKIDYLQVSVITNCHISPFTLLNVGCLHAMITSVYSVVGATMNTKLTADAEQLKGQGGKKERGG